MICTEAVGFKQEGTNNYLPLILKTEVFALFSTAASLLQFCK